jgi:hypothetical protein
VGRPLRLFFAIVTLAAGSSAGSRPAQAATTEADELVDQAVRLRRNNGDDEGALALLLHAYALEHSPRATGQLGLCYQALGRWAEAEAYLTEALRAEQDPWVEKNRRTLEDSLTVVKSHVARIEIDGEPTGAEVWVNGSLVGKLPLSAPVHVTAGEEVEVELRSPGFVRETKTLRLEAGQYQRIVVRASAVHAPPAPMPQSSPTPPLSAAAAAVDLHQPQAEKPPRTIPFGAVFRDRRPLKWVAWGLGAAAVGVGIYGAIGNASGASNFDKGCRLIGDRAVAYPSGMPSKECADQKSEYESKATISIAGFVAAGAFVLTGFALWLSEPSGRASHTAGLTCAPTASHRLPLALGCAVSF